MIYAVCKWKTKICYAVFNDTRQLILGSMLHAMITCVFCLSLIHLLTLPHVRCFFVRFEIKKSFTFIPSINSCVSRWRYIGHCTLAFENHLQLSSIWISQSYLFHFDSNWIFDALTRQTFHIYSHIYTVIVSSTIHFLSLSLNNLKPSIPPIDRLKKRECTWVLLTDTGW